MCSKCNNNNNNCGCTTSTISFIYEGQELTCIDVPTGMSLEGVLTQINSKFCELITTVTNTNISNYTLNLNNNDLILSNSGNTVSIVDISNFLDNLNLARIVSYTINSESKIINLIRDNNTTIPIDISSMFSVGANTTNSSLSVTGITEKVITLNDSEGNDVRTTFIDNNTTNSTLTVTGDTTTKTITLTDSDNNSISTDFITNSDNQSRIENSSLSIDPGTFNATTQGGTTPDGELSLIREDNTEVNIDVTQLVPTGLVKTELGNTGFVLAGIDRAIKSTMLGNKAIDMTTTVVGGITDFGASGTASTAIGSTALSEGNFSISIGSTSRAIGNSSISVGWASESGGDRSTALGTGKTTGLYSACLGTYINQSGIPESVGESSVAIGFSSKSVGNKSVAIGTDTEAHSYAETVIGTYSKDYVPQSITESVDTDKLFVVGNGKILGNSVVKSNAFEIYKNGASVFKPMLEPTNPEEGMFYFDITTKKLRCYDGTTWQDLF